MRKTHKKKRPHSKRKSRVGFQVFISHASTDTWVATQIASEIKRCGGTFFLDVVDIDHGDDFEKEILSAARSSREMILLLTPWAMNRLNVWIEVGVFWGTKKRIVGVLHGITPKSISKMEKIPLALKKINLLQLNDIESYFTQLSIRISKWKSNHA